MARLALPQRGQPLDVSLVYEIINSINELYTNSNRSTYSSLGSTLDLSQPNTVKTANSKIVTGTINVDSTKTKAVFNFPGNNFSRPPIVTATPNKVNATINIDLVTTSSVTFNVSVPSGTTGTVSISVIAIGEAV